ncbi:hypothetical protein AWC38_SpisGene7046 [Stylophora pistillata]|uniref:Uncharacterized protein n=2 Tax=Stylophora pistillata TaxID=50429 RepID=A0A2B4SI58_STYPI|nr:hypothetical protein AWC38_SpisGene7046 [Stylophora pistillata]
MRIGTQRFPVYCHLSRTDLGPCGAGGWTLVMKIDGKERTFHWGSSLWQNNQTFNLAGGETGFDEEETKLPTYWGMPFTKICLGIKIGQQHKFILVEREADSLYSLIADGKYRHTSLGRDTWKSLIGSQASLQLKCNKEGFNAVGSLMNSKARIGIVANEQNNCHSCDSRIGFGTGGSPDDSNTCGNVAVGRYGADNGDKGVKAMGYILIQ